MDVAMSSGTQPSPDGAVFDYYGLLHRAAARYAARTALLADDERISYAAVKASADAVAAGLAALGVGPGDRVALCLGNEPEWIYTFFALSRLRAVAVMMSTSWMARELRHALALTAPVAIVADGDRRELVDEAGRPERAVVVHGGAGRPGWLPFEELTDRADALPAWSAGRAGPAGAVADLELALPFSSGTTGLPKAVRHTHRTLTLATSQWRGGLGLTDTDRLQALTPLSHILGIVNVGATISSGATIRLFRKFSARTMVDSFEADKITVGMTVAPIAAALAAMPDLTDYDLSSLRYLNWSATPVNAEIARRLTERTGIGWLPAYGTTEVPVLAVTPPDAVDNARLDSVGKPPPAVQVEAADPATGALLKRGEVGELVALSPAAMLGYLPEPEESPFLAGGWYRTGDQGYVNPEGWVVITGRIKELIKVSGYQVSPVEIEGVLATSSLVRDCAVFGVPDERRGETPVAAVVPADPATADAAQLIAWLTPQLAHYKQLRAVYFVPEVPRTASGKIQRHKVRALVAELAAPDRGCEGGR
jgi:acyl-CoA synthetase (AMP-forming)/AMP-acid ligase II